MTVISSNTHPMRTWHALLMCAFWLSAITATAQETRVRGTNTTTTAPQQVVIMGKIVDEDTKEPLAGVNVAVVGTVLGTITNTEGNFTLQGSLSLPLTLRVSYVGYSIQAVQVTQSGVRLNVQLSVEGVQANEVVVSASRIEETILEAPVTIEKFDQLAVRQTGSSSYYQGLSNLKGIDITTSSINFQILNARGFGSTGNTRFIQLVDGMDTQAPGLNFPIGNLNGPNELDVAGIEFIPGASSALYGPSAFNGALVLTSKNPFDYQGLSASYKVGVNHVNAPDRGTGMVHDFAIRYAKSFANDRWAFKVAASYFQAPDWRGNDLSDKFGNNSPAPQIYGNRQGELSFNPGADLVHAFGDEVATNIGSLPGDPTALAGIEAGLVGLGLPTSYVSSLEGTQQVVSRTPYGEQFLVDYDANNIKAAASLHWRVTNKVELSAAYSGGYGTTVYTGSQRFSIKNFNIQQIRLEAKGDNFFVRAYTTLERSGDSYISDITGVLVNSQWKDDGLWFTGYGVGYLYGLSTVPAANGGPVAPGAFGSPAQQSYAHSIARQFADRTSSDPTISAIISNPALDALLGNPRILPQTPAFDQAVAQATNSVIPAGALFNDKSNMYHAEGQYDFKRQIDFVDLQVGGSVRIYELNSGGTIFTDTSGNIYITELGVYAQATKKLLDDKLRITGSIRWDYNENFTSQFNPRISAVYNIGGVHNFRVSYQTGFRFPTTQGQYINLDALNARLLGGLPEISDLYNLRENTYTTASVNRFNESVLAFNAGLISAPDFSLLQPHDVDKVKPERVQGVEIGYKSLIGGKLFLDAVIYGSLYKDFIGQVFVTQYPSDPTDLSNIDIGDVWGSAFVQSSANTYFPYENSKTEVYTVGAAFSAEYVLPKNFAISGNYNYNRLTQTEREAGISEQEDLVDAFNTPQHKANFSFGNRRVLENGSFNITWRWQDAYFWEASFASGTVKAVNTLDAQISWKVPQAKTVVKLGGQNLLNYRHVLNYGGPTLGAIYYLQLTFDQFLN